jgi:hypothetical protein
MSERSLTLEVFEREQRQRAADLRKRGKFLTAADYELTTVQVIAGLRREIRDELEPLKQEVAALKQRVAELEQRPQVRHRGTWSAGALYPENSLLTDHGGMWLAKQATETRPPGDHWQLVVKAGEAVTNGHRTTRSSR